MADRIVARSLKKPWTAHKARWSSCTDCDLCATRHKVVLFRGRVPCDILYIGEAPGETEDMLGSPMEGPTKTIMHGIHTDVTDALGLGTLSYAITNTIACRPPNNRDPNATELRACRERLQQFLYIAKPKLVVLAGGVAAKQAHVFSSMKVAEIPHPSYIKRMEQDNQSVRAELLYRNAVRAILKAYKD